MEGGRWGTGGRAADGPVPVPGARRRPPLERAKQRAELMPMPHAAHATCRSQISTSVPSSTCARLHGMCMYACWLAGRLPPRPPSPAPRLPHRASQRRCARHPGGVSRRTPSLPLRLLGCPLLPERFDLGALVRLEGIYAVLGPLGRLARRRPHLVRRLLRLLRSGGLHAPRYGLRAGGAPGGGRGLSREGVGAGPAKGVELPTTRTGNPQQLARVDCPLCYCVSRDTPQTKRLLSHRPTC